MKRGLYLIGLCAAIGLATVGCGGSSNNGNGITNSPYKGSYVGTFTYNGGGLGEFAVYINTNGGVSGRGVNTTFPAAQTLSGSVNNSGLISVASNGTAGSTTYSGAIALTSPPSLTGTLSSVGGTLSSVAIAAPAISSSSVYPGSYHGSFTNASSQNNNLTFVIDGNGNITGVDQNTSTSTFSTLTGAVQLSGGGVSMTSSSGGGTITGTFSVTNGILTGSLNGNGSLPTSITLTQDTKQ
jgi:hypothetical protein